MQRSARYRYSFRAAVALVVAASCGLGLHAFRQSSSVVMGGTQPPPVTVRTGTALLSGRIVDAAGGAVAGAVVSLGGGLSMVGLTTVVQGATEVGPRRVLTNSDGRFVFFDLPAGSYSIDATRPGYVAGAYGRLRVGGVAQSIDLAEGQQQGDLVIRVWKFAAISGLITDEIGEPAVGVQVTALRRAVDSGHVRLNTALGAAGAITDDRGVFRIASLVPGEYVICVPSTISTMPIEILDGYQQSRLDGTFAEWSRQMSAAGVSNIMLNPNQPGFRVGDRMLQFGGFTNRPMTPPQPSDDGRLAIYPTVFYPGTFAAGQAQPIALGSGEERTGVLLQLRLISALTVSGVITGPDGPVGRVGVRLVPSSANEYTSEQGFEAGSTIADGRGRFEFLGVPAGQYTIRVVKVPPTPPRPPVVQMQPGAPPVPAAIALAPPPGPTLWANMPIAVGDESLRNVVVTLNRGVRVSGRIEFEGTEPRPPLELLPSISITLIPADGRATGSGTPLQAAVDATGRISTYEIPPSKYLIGYAASLETRRALGRYLFKSATIGGRDVYSVPFDLQNDVTDLVVTMTDRPAELVGTVRDAQGRVDPTAAVLIISVDQAAWSNYGTNPTRIRTVRPAKDGSFRLINFPPGEYYAVAVPEAQAGVWQDPRVLETIVRGAARFSIAFGEKKTQDVTVRAVR